MKHGNEIFIQARRLFLILCLVIAVAGVVGCKSARKAVIDTRSEAHLNHADSSQVDSVLISGADRWVSTDTSNVSTDVRGTMEIERDTAGRPVVIYWTYSANLEASSKSETSGQSSFSALNASHIAADTGTMDTVDEKKEEATQEVNTEISLSRLIGPGALGVALLYLLYRFFINIVLPWLKQKRSR